MQSKVTPELLNIYINETEKSIGNIAKELLLLKQDINNQNLVQSIKRLLHTIKGSSSMIGFQDASELAHKMEDFFLKIQNKEIKITPEIIKLIFTELGILNRFIRKLKGENIDVDFASSFKRLDKIIFDQFDIKHKIKKITDFTPDQQTSIQNALSGYLNIYKIEIQFVPETNNKQVLSSIVLNTLSQLGLIIDTVPEEENILAGKFGNLVKILFISSSEKDEISTSLQAIQSSVKNLKIDKIEKTLTEEELFNLLYVSEDSVITFEYGDEGAVELRKGIQKYSLKDVLEQLKNIVVKVARDNNKIIKLEIDCDKIHIKERYIKEITNILIHLIRNAADHGIENKFYREYLNKEPEGKITITAKIVDNEKLYIKIADDGQGIPIEKIKSKIIKMGLVSPEEVDRLSKSEIINFIFKPGFSTAEKVTDISGRGIGMDLIKDIIQKLNGEIKVTTEEKKGTVFEIILPQEVLST